VEKKPAKEDPIKVASTNPAVPVVSVTKIPPPPPPEVVLPSELTLKTAEVTLVLIPKGTFPMGSADGEGDPNEHPRHEVSISRPYYMGRTEVTQEQYERVMDVNPSYFFKSGMGAERVAGLATNTHPVEQVGYDDAQEFCRKLALRENLPEGSIRLPTEARNGNMRHGRIRSDGDGRGPLAAGLGSRKNSRGQTHPVAVKRPNAFQLFDMGG